MLQNKLQPKLNPHRISKQLTLNRKKKSISTIFYFELMGEKICGNFHLEIWGLHFLQNTTPSPDLTVLLIITTEHAHVWCFLCAVVLTCSKYTFHLIAGQMKFFVYDYGRLNKIYLLYEMSN